MQKKAFISTLLVTSALIYSTPVSAADNIESLMDLSLDALLQREVYAASKRVEKLRHAPGVINVVSKDEIRRYGGRSLVDILQRLPGVNIGGGSIYRDTIPVIRGQSKDIDTQTLILLNGRPFRDMVSSGVHGPIYQFFPVEAIDHIEVIRGPGSVLHGSHAFTGVINIVTIDPEDSRITVAGTGGSDSYRKEEIYAAHRGDESHVIVAGTRMKTDGWSFTATDSNSVTQTEDWDSAGFGGFFQAAIDNFTLNAYSGYENQRNMGVQPTWPSSPAKNRTSLIDVGYSHELSEDWTAQLNVTYNGHKQYVRELGPFIITPSSNGVLTELAFDGVINDRTNVAVGGLHERYSSTMKSLGGQYDTNRSSAYLQMDHRPMDDLKLIAGLQVNKISGLDPNYSPRLGAIYDFTENTGIKMLYSEAYKAPVGSTTVLSSPFIVGDPDIEPELIETYDIQWFYEADKFYFSTTGFHSRTTDLMDARFDPSRGLLAYSNGSEVNSKGIELEGKYYFDEEWQMEASFAINEVDELPVENDSWFAPNKIGKLGVSYANDYKGVVGGLFYHYFDAPRNTIGSPTANPFQVNANPVPEAYHLLNANLELDLNTVLDWQSSIDTDLVFYANNLLDEDSYYAEVQTHMINSMPWQSGRTFYATLKFTF